MVSSSATIERHGPSTPVVDFDPNPDPFRYEGGTRRWVAWPFWAFKVNVETPVNYQFNLLERFVLKTSRAGARKPERIAEILQLEVELVEFIVDELVARQFLDGELVVTSKAEESLRKDEQREPEQKSGYVFSDAVSGRLWPRFVVGGLKHCEAEIRPGGGAVVERGSVGNPHSTYPFVVWPDKMSGLEIPVPEAPTSFAIADAVRGASRARREHRRLAGDDEVPQSAGQFVTDRVAKNARLIDERPLPYFLLTYLHMPENLERSSSWQVCDPFGLGLSNRLRKIIDESIQKGERVLKEHVVEDVIGGSYEVDDAELADLLSAGYESADQRIDEEFGQWIPEEPRLKLCQMEQAYDEACEALHSSGESMQDTDRHVRTFLRSAQAGLEELFVELVALYAGESDERATPLLSKLGNSAAANGELISRLAKKLGFEVDESASEVLSIQRSRAKGVLEYGNGDLTTCFAVLVLQAEARADHPARMLAGDCRNVASFLAKLRRLRGAANHAAEHGIDPGSRLSADDIKQLRMKVFQIFDALLPGTVDASDIDSLDDQGPTWDAELMCKLRAAAARQVRERVGAALNDRPVLKGRLVETVQGAREVEVLSGDSNVDDTGAAERRLQDLAFAANSACEAIAKELVQSFQQCQMPDRFGSERRDNVPHLVELGKKFGFEFNAESDDAETLLMVAPGRLRGAVEEGRGSLNSLVWAAVIRADESGVDVSGTLEQIASKHPGFLDDMAWISASRGHGNELRIGRKDVERLVDTVFRQVKTVFDIIQ